MVENRNAKRFIEEIDGSISFIDKEDSGSEKSVSMKAKDISLHGAKITSSKSFPVNSNLRITFNLTRSNQVVTFNALIVWVKEKDDEDSYEMGIEFVHDRKTIENLHMHLFKD